MTMEYKNKIFSHLDKTFAFQVEGAIDPEQTFAFLEEGAIDPE